MTIIIIYIYNKYHNRRRLEEALECSTPPVSKLAIYCDVNRRRRNYFTAI